MEAEEHAAEGIAMGEDAKFGAAADEVISLISARPGASVSVRHDLGDSQGSKCGEQVWEVSVGSQGSKCGEQVWGPVWEVSVGSQCGKVRGD
eukprot:6354653-Prymnesium_polylepis.1